mgnify:CR=1 FL=1
MQGELVLVGELAGRADAYRTLAAAAGVPLRALHAERSALVPVLWGEGLAAARGTAVAFTINECVVQEGWSRTLVDGLRGTTGGVGGRLRLDATASRTARAIFYLRYAAFLGTVDEPAREVRDVAGDNAAYRRDVLLRYPQSLRHGFWEVETHHYMRADGVTLALLPGMDASFGGAPRLARLVRQRFAHGAHFGAWRVASGGRRRWQIVLAAPLVPFALLMRAARAGARAGRPRGELASVVLPFLALATAWAVGEAVGAVAGRPG